MLRCSMSKQLQLIPRLGDGDGRPTQSTFWTLTEISANDTLRLLDPKPSEHST
jgi:hypothetical protein